MLRGVLVLLGLLGLVVVVFLLWPAPIDSERFDPAPGPALAGPLSPEGHRLSGCELFAEEIEGPEELEVDAEGRVYAGDRSGRIWRLVPRGEGYAASIFAEVGGQPNGVTLDAAGRLVVSDGYFVPPSWVLPDGTVRRFPVAHGADAAAARDGTLYLVRAPEWRRTGKVLVDFMLHLLEAHPDGELVAFDPDTGETRVLARGLVTADGIALSRDEDFVTVGEVGAYRLTRHWLRGPRAGRTEVWVANLPGMPDGLAVDDAGNFYVAMAALRIPLLDRFHRHPAWKDHAAKLLVWLGPGLAPTGGGAGDGGAYGLVVVVDGRGVIARSYHDPDPIVGGPITTAVPHGGHLFVASLMGRGIARCEL